MVAKKISTYGSTKYDVFSGEQGNITIYDEEETTAYACRFIRNYGVSATTNSYSYKPASFPYTQSLPTDGTITFTFELLQSQLANLTPTDKGDTSYQTMTKYILEAIKDKKKHVIYLEHNDSWAESVVRDRTGMRKCVFKSLGKSRGNPNSVSVSVDVGNLDE